VPYRLPEVDVCGMCEAINSPDTRTVNSSAHGLVIVPVWMRTHGSCAVASRRHAPTMFSLAVEEMRDILALAHTTVQRIAREIDPDGLHFWWDTGLLADQALPHFFIEVVPRYQNQEYRYQLLTELPVRPAGDLDAALRALTPGGWDADSHLERSVPVKSTGQN
jgi:diadenosine tetraphosphate (Ap4A) HIT family hydrolase